MRTSTSNTYVILFTNTHAHTHTRTHTHTHCHHHAKAQVLPCCVYARADLSDHVAVSLQIADEDQEKFSDF